MAIDASPSARSLPGPRAARTTVDHEVVVGDMVARSLFVKHHNSMIDDV
ncbi:hypothetical protein ACGF3C_01560 [Micromonospora sp. NPDC047762]